MNFSQLNPLLSETVTLLKIEFADSTRLNYPKTIHGTGFWIRNNENALTLVTNRHNLDPSLKDMRMKGYRIGKIEILAREYIDGLYTSKTAFFQVDLLDLKGVVHEAADVAILTSPRFRQNASVQGNFRFEPLSFSEVAEEAFFDNIAWFDNVAFLGYPNTWYNTARMSPIGRLAHIASDPRYGFENHRIKTSNILLVAGLSFNGSSGSPVFLLQKGLKIETGPGIQVNSPFVPSRLIGIMSGHYNIESTSSTQDGLELHSGLSYFTKSSSILELLEEKGTPINEFLYRFQTEDASLPI